MGNGETNTKERSSTTTEPLEQTIERGILGAALNHFYLTMPELVLRVRTSWYNNPQNAAIWNTLVTIFESGHYPNPETVSKRTYEANKDAFDSVEHAQSTVETLLTYSPTLDGVQSLTADFEHIGRKKGWKQVSNEILTIASDEQDAHTMDERIVTHVMHMASQSTAADGIDNLDSLKAFRNEYQSLDTAQRWDYPLATLNSRGGYKSGNVIVVSAYTGEGKSFLGLQFLEAAAKQGARVAVFSMEMSKEELTARLFAMDGLDLESIEDKKTAWQDMTARAVELGAYNYTIFEGATTVNRIRAACRRAQAIGKPFDVVIVDHVHLLNVCLRPSEYRIALNNALSDIKVFANQQKCAFILLAQLRRPQEDRKVPPAPTMSMLKESSAIEQIADRIIFIYRDRDSDSGETLKEGKVWVAKQRQGRPPPPTNVELSDRHNQFVELVASPNWH